jgi:hypothetical protein
VTQLSSEAGLPRAKSPYTADPVTTSGEPVHRPPSHFDKHPVDFGHVTDRWGDNSLIGVKPLSSNTPLYENSRSAKPNHVSNGPMAPRALPGLTSVREPEKEPDVSMARHSSQVVNKVGQEPPNSESEPNGVRDGYPVPRPRLHTASALNAQSHPQSEVEHDASTTQPDEPAPVASPVVPPKQKEERPPISPVRHSRIPSSGNRATVMDIAQAWSTQSQPTSPGWIEHRAEPSGDEVPNEETIHSPEVVKPVVSNFRSTSSPAMQAEKRKSSYEKYSAIMMPPLEEERTPVSTPSGSLLRSTVPPLLVQNENTTRTELSESQDKVIHPTIATQMIVSAESADLVHIGKPYFSPEFGQHLPTHRTRRQRST